MLKAANAADDGVEPRFQLFEKGVVLKRQGNNRTDATANGAILFHSPHSAGGEMVAQCSTGCRLCVTTGGRLTLHVPSITHVHGKGSRTSVDLSLTGMSRVRMASEPSTRKMWREQATV